MSLFRLYLTQGRSDAELAAIPATPRLLMQGTEHASLT